MKTLINRLMPRSIRGRLTFLFSVVFGAALVITSFICFKVFTHAHLQDFDAFLFNHAFDVADVLTEDPDHIPAIVPALPGEHEKHRLFSIKRTYMQLTDLAGQVVSRSGTQVGNRDLPRTEKDLRAKHREEATYRTIKSGDFIEGSEADDKTYRLISYLIPDGQGRPLLLQIAAPLTLLEQENAEFLWLLILLIPCAGLISGILGYLASHRAFSPVLRMAQKTAQIEMKSLKERIEVKENDAELKELGGTLNQLLERVEKAVGAQERFVADASHQLKTPLAILHGELELLQAHPTHPPEVAEALKSASQEASQLIGLVENLLLLARMDAGLAEIPFSSVRLDETLSEAMSRLRTVAKRKGIVLSWDLTPYTAQAEGQIDFEFQGDNDLIRCLMENLIENAIKYSPPGTQVDAHLTERESDYLLEIADRGKGITEEEAKTLFDRFWRDPLKSLTVTGAGLGLAIAKKITEIHRGVITVKSRLGGGSSFLVQLSKS